MHDAPSIDIDALLDDQPLRLRHGMIIGALLMMFFVNNFCTQILAMTAPAMAAQWRVGAQAIAAPMAIGWLGAAIGTLVGGLVSDRLGRRWTVVVATAVAGAATLTTGFAHDATDLLPLRVLAGLGLGGAFSSGLALASECVPARRRGMVVSATMLCGPLGIICCAMLAGFVIPRFGWALQFFVGGGAMMMVAAIACVALIESPRFLARHPHRRAEMSRSLTALGAALDPGVPIVAPAAEQRSSLAAILVPGMRAVTITAWLSFFAIFFVVSALLVWLPTILANAGYAVSAGSEAISTWSGAGIVGTITSGWCIGRFGARNTARVQAVAASVSLVALVLVPLDPHGGRMALILPMMLAGFSMSGLMTALFAHVTAIYPPQIRSTGLGMADMVGRGTSVIASFSAIYVLQTLGFRGFFGALAVLLVVPALVLAGRNPADPAQATP